MVFEPVITIGNQADGYLALEKGTDKSRRDAGFLFLTGANPNLLGTQYPAPGRQHIILPYLFLFLISLRTGQVTCLSFPLGRSKLGQHDE